MISLSVPFLLSNPEQIPPEVKSNEKILLEGNVFDAALFTDADYWKKLENVIKDLNIQYPGKLYSLHFPTENADYMQSGSVEKYLFRFLDLVIKNNIQILVLHTNHIVPHVQFNYKSIISVRKKYFKFFNKIDTYIKGTNSFVCIENLPIIGNNGDDFDSVFVFPEDFSGLKFERVKIVWDIGHWAYTWSVLKSLNNISPYIMIKPIGSFDSFLSLRDEIKYFQFSSFKTIAFPGTRSKCLEGIVPSKGDIDEHLLRDVLLLIHSWNESYVMSLEIQDEDYKNRINLLDTIDWIDRIILLQ